MREQDMAFVIDLRVSAIAIQITTQQKAPANNAAGARDSSAYGAGGLSPVKNARALSARRALSAIGGHLPLRRVKGL
jgi:hypothetical protein